MQNTKAKELADILVTNIHPEMQERIDELWEEHLESHICVPTPEEFIKLVIEELFYMGIND